MNQNELSLEVANAEYHFLHVGISCDESKQIKFGCDKCGDCKSTIFCMLEHYGMNQNTFCFQVMNIVILQNYCFLPDGTLLDASKRIFF